MKISMCTTGVNQNQGGNQNRNQSKFQIPLNPKAMDVSKAVVYEQYITVPYADPALLHDENVQETVTHIADQTDWVIPDYNRTKFNLVFEVNEDFEVIGSTLQVNAQPPVYTEQEKADILKHETDEEMYITWQEIFYYAEDFYKNKDEYFDDNYDEFDIELDEGELSHLQSNILKTSVQALYC